MTAKSKKQQQLMGMVHAYQQGELEDAPESIKKIAKDIDPEDAEDFASTKHTKLPTKVKKEQLKELIKTLIKSEISKLHEGYYQWHKLEMTAKEERFMDDLEYELEKVFPGKGKKIGTFIVSIFDIYDSPPNDIGDIVRGGGKDKLIKYAKRTGLKPLKRAI